MTDVQLFIDADATPVNQRGSLYTWDDFQSLTGFAGFEFSGSGSPVFTDLSTSLADHPGVVSMATDTTSGHEAQAILPAFYESRLQTFEWIFQVPDSTSMTMRIGMADGTVIVGNGVLIEFDTSAGDTALSLCKYVSTTRTVGATLALNTGHWYRANWSRSGSGTGTLVLTDIDAATSATYGISGLSAGTKWEALGYVKTLTTALRRLYLDWFQAAQSGMAR